MSDLIRALAAHDGGRIDGGCDRCDAYQTVAIVGPGIASVTVHHDETCPVLADHQRRSRP